MRSTTREVPRSPQISYGGGDKTAYSFGRLRNTYFNRKWSFEFIVVKFCHVSGRKVNTFIFKMIKIFGKRRVFHWLESYREYQSFFHFLLFLMAGIRRGKEWKGEGEETKSSGTAFSLGLSHPWCVF